MKCSTAFILFFLVLSIPAAAQEKLQYHIIKKDKQGKIIPWYDADPGISYNHVINLVWNFWDTMRRDMNGLPYYMNHQVWKPDFNDPRGLGEINWPWHFLPGVCITNTPAMNA